MPVTTTDEVVAALEDIVRRALADGDRLGYFPALYNRVTQSVRDDMRRGAFDDNARMERFDVIFARRYLDAYDAQARGDRPSLSWLRAFEAAGSDDLLVIQHLLLGMNAHITLDLGIAAAETSPGPAIEALHDDFFRINDILASLIGTVEDELVAVARVWRPAVGDLLGRAEQAAGGLDRKAGSLLMDGARDLAWAFAQRLARKDRSAWQDEIEQQDAQAALLADGILLGEPVVELLAAERGVDVRENLRILVKGESGL